jgi:hypothetical protein
MRWVKNKLNRVPLLIKEILIFFGIIYFIMLLPDKIQLPIGLVLIVFYLIWHLVSIGKKLCRVCGKSVFIPEKGVSYFSSYYKVYYTNRCMNCGAWIGSVPGKK